MVTAAPHPTPAILTQVPAPRQPGPAAPAQPVRVAWAARTSTLEMQDPVASLRRQYRTAQASLLPGFQIVAWYWDIESGALDLADRSKTDTWQHVAGHLGIPRDGGLADLLAAAARPARPFDVVVCEGIDRIARDTLASLTVEKELGRHGIPIFAADEPASIEGASPTTILVRRVKQGFADFYRLQLLANCWNGLVQHAIDGWNIGPAPYGYQSDRVPHANPAKASQGRTRARLVPDPVNGPVVTQIFHWRVNRRLSVPTIAWRLNSDPESYPPPGGAPGWAESSVSALLRNPKYTGYMVYGRTRKDPGSKKTRQAPPEAWIWSPQPVHPPLTPLATWQAAQKIGAERGNVRDSEKPTTQPGSRYALRSRIRHQACQRRMYGTRRPSSSKTNPGAVYTYYYCPYNPSNPRHVAAHPGHVSHSVSIREEAIVAAVTDFLDQYVFGYDRAAHLAALIPATTDEHAAARKREENRLHAELTRIEAAQAGLDAALEQLGADTSPAAKAYRDRTFTRLADLHDEHTAIKAQLAALQATTGEAGQDPGLLDELPYLTSQLADAPAELIEALLEALDIQILYRPEQGQATIWATLTDTTPETINALLADPRITANQTPAPATTAPTTSPNADSAQGPIEPKRGHDHGFSPKLATIMRCRRGAEGTLGRGGRAADGAADFEAGVEAQAKPNGGEMLRGAEIVARS